MQLNPEPLNTERVELSVSSVGSEAMQLNLASTTARRGG